MKLLTLSQVVDRFNAVSPTERDKRTVQRWLAQNQITGAGTSRHNWFYPAEAVDAALAKDFPWQDDRRPARRSRKAGVK